MLAREQHSDPALWFRRRDWLPESVGLQYTIWGVLQTNLALTRFSAGGHEGRTYFAPLTSAQKVCWEGVRVSIDLIRKLGMCSRRK